MSQARHDKEASNAVDARSDRLNDISKALGMILETIDGAFRKYRQRTPAADQAYDANDIKTIMTHIAIWYRETLGSTATDVIATSEADIKKSNGFIRSFKAN
jgi:hypothetical protein